MRYVTRIFDSYEKLKQKSYFLFGPRQTGKSCLIEHSFKGTRVYDLLDSDVYLSLSRNHKLIEQELGSQDRSIIIDEIQKLPSLLDEVHRLIEKRHIHFLLTGSSARKLRRGGVNLLGGRARIYNLHPFVKKELQNKFNLLTALNNGLLPSIYFSEYPQEDLKTYVGSYLTQEIAAEGLVRSIPAFNRFLEVAALCSAKIINYSNISNDAQVPSSTVQEYFQILRDTLVGFDVHAWQKSTKRKPVSTSKFYFFDVGVVRYLQHRGKLLERSPEFGEAFETYIAHELKSFVDYSNAGDLCYWRSKSGFEVDFIVNNTLAVEVKAKEHIGYDDLKGLKAIAEENKLEHLVLISLEKRPRQIDNISILPWDDFLERLWQRQYC